MADNQGTEEEGTGCNGWFFVEAIVERKTGDIISDDEPEDVEDSGLDMVDFIDNSISQVEGQENPQALLHAQQLQADVEAVQQLKRKYIGSPYVSPVANSEPCVEKDLSPRLGAISLGRRSAKAKRRLFDKAQPPPNGHTDVEAAVEVNTEGTEQTETEQVQTASGETSTDSLGRQQITELIHNTNIRVALFGMFKELYGLSFMDLARSFKSDRTVCTDWVIAAFGIYHGITEGFKTLLEPHCLYGHIQWLTCRWGMVLLLLTRFKCGKNRLTVGKCLGMLLNIPETQMLIDPPKLRTPAAALYWYRQGLSNASEIFGTPPEWLSRQTVIECSLADSQFDLSKMVQWAYDHNYVDDSIIALEYAKLADIDENAAAFLGSNCQAKYVKDCGTMCRHYLRAQKMQMTMAQWIKHRCDLVEEEGNWKEIVRFLRFQHVDFISFMIALKKFLQGIPKHNCILIYGPPDTGKSNFAMSLISFLGGAVLSYVNSSSHFWLEPLADAKIAMLDDATTQCRNYMDIYMRNALDGNPMCFDRKHRAMVQTKCPPLLVTSNINVSTDDRWRYLHSRVKCFCFPNRFPFDSNGNPVYDISNKNWKSFFKRSWSRLALNDNDNEEEEENGDSSNTFRCVPGKAPRPI
uniref:Replication protein E1 n=1 Tax=Human papillomavirus type 54 TaxID=1671798 RepID=A0A0P0F252_HPV54|nr:early protein E1 [Human papillomavirus type 54]